MSQAPTETRIPGQNGAMVGDLCIPPALATPEELLALARGLPSTATPYAATVFAMEMPTDGEKASSGDILRACILAIKAGHQVDDCTADSWITEANAPAILDAARGIGIPRSRLHRRAWAVSVATDPMRTYCTVAEFLLLSSWLHACKRSPPLPVM